jgi:FkbM family methyltransferase
MLKEYIEFYKKISNYNPTNILHIGGHIGQEGEIYKDICPFTFVEPVAKFAEIIADKGYRVINTAIGSSKGERTFYVRNQISSLLMTKVNHGQTKTTVQVVRLKDIQEGFDALIVDVEGATMEVLKSGDLSKFKVIIAELRDDPAFIGEATKQEVIMYLKEKGFKIIYSFDKDYLFINQYKPF